MIKLKDTYELMKMAEKEALNDDKRSIDFLNYLHLMIPTYWENPKINDNYLKG